MAGNKIVYFSFQYGTELFDSIKVRWSVDQLSNYQLVKQEFPPWT
jgi:hypothetical protein